MQRITDDHEAIRAWAEGLGGRPVVIDHPVARADKRGIRIAFPGETHEVLKSETRPATWEEFFRIFDEQRLLLSYDEQPSGGDPTEWYRFERRDEEGNPPR